MRNTRRRPLQSPRSGRSSLHSPTKIVTRGTSCRSRTRPRSHVPLVLDLDAETLTIEGAAERLRRVGDVFGAEVARIGLQRFAAIGHDGGGPSTPLGMTVGALAMTTNGAGVARSWSVGPVFEFVPRAEVIQVAYQVLSDGKPRSADEIIDAAIALEVWPKEKSRKYLYVMLKMYVEKTLARGREPLIIQDPDRRFRLNHTPDDNPEPKAVAPWVVPKALIALLRAASTRKDSEAFELAVCEAFVPLGFTATHVGGNEKSGWVRGCRSRTARVSLHDRVQDECEADAAAGHLRGSQLPRTIRGAVRNHYCAGLR